jgi:hypothetical protein
MNLYKFRETIKITLALFVLASILHRQETCALQKKPLSIIEPYDASEHSIKLPVFH